MTARSRARATAGGGEALLRPVYSAAVRLLQALAAVAPAGESKLARALRARRGLLESYSGWGASARDRTCPLLWIHAPSVGEGLQAQPVIALVRERRPDVQIAYTFFSPSAEPFAARIPADFRAYLPFDHPRDCTAAIAALDPQAVVFCKADVWPNLVAAAAELGIPTALISGTVPEGSMRVRAPTVTLMRSTFARLVRVGAIDESDAARLVAMGVARDRVSVTGDTRFDQVWERAALPPPEPVERLNSDRPTIVAGSTWPSDEEVLLPTVQAVRRAHKSLRLIIAPHEVTPSRVSALHSAIVPSGASVTRFSDADPDGDVVIVDAYGALGDLYRLATIAFVGGGFHRAGLHSVLEPAAFGAPVVFGPLHTGSRDAKLLIAAGGGRAVARRVELEAVLTSWLGTPSERDSAGAAARELVRTQLGAAQRSYDLITGLLPSA